MSVSLDNNRDAVVVTSRIVTTTGTAYVKTTRLKTFVRAIRRIVKIVKKTFEKTPFIRSRVVEDTCSGKVTTLAPPNDMKKNFKG